MVVTSTMFVHGGGLQLSGAPGLAASPGAAASVRDGGEEREFSTTPHEDRLAREVAPFQGERFAVDADDDAFPPSVLDPDGREHDAADADFVPALRSRGPAFGSAGAVGAGPGP